MSICLLSGATSERAAELRAKMKSASDPDDMDTLCWTLFCPFP
jgi:hypothetical protein